MVNFSSVLSTAAVFPMLALLADVPKTAMVSAYEVGKPAGSVVALKSDTFQTAISDPVNPLWFLKFYAPWCGHCKRLAPVLDQVAPKLKGKMAIGKIDCTVSTEKQLCSDNNVRGYPTLKFSLDGTIHEYPGSRDEQSIIQFATKMSGPSVKLVKSYDKAMEYVATQTEEGVAFLGYDTEATSTTKPDGNIDVDELLKSTPLGQAYAQVARKEKASSHFLWLEPESEGIDKGIKRAVYRIETEFDAHSWDANKANDPTADGLLEFVKEFNIPSLSILGPGNFQKVGNKGRPLVISVVDMKNDALVGAVKEHMIKFISSPKAKQFTDQYYFSMMDGTKWKKFLEQFNVHQEENPQVIVLDVPTKKYWQNATFTTVGEFLKGVANGTISQEVSTGRPGASGILGRIENLFVEFFPYSLIFVIFFVIIFVILIVIMTGDDSVPPYERPNYDDDDFGDEDEAEPTEGNGNDSAPAKEAKKDK